MSIKAISKKKIGLRSGTKVVIMEPMVYTELPDDIQADPMFDWAKADGTLQVIGGEEKPKAKGPKGSADNADKQDAADGTAP